MGIYRVSGSIMCEGEFEAESEEEAINLFRGDHTFKRDSGMEISPTVEDVDLIEVDEEEETYGHIYVYVGVDKVMDFDLDECKLSTLKIDVNIPSHNLGKLWSWIEDCNRWADGFANILEMNDLKL